MNVCIQQNHLQQSKRKLPQQTPSSALGAKRQMSDAAQQGGQQRSMQVMQGGQQVGSHIMQQAQMPSGSIGMGKCQFHVFVIDIRLQYFITAKSFSWKETGKAKLNQFCFVVFMTLFNIDFAEKLTFSICNFYKNFVGAHGNRRVQLPQARVQIHPQSKIQPNKVQNKFLIFF